MKRLFLLILGSFFLSGCISIHRTEKTALRDLERYGISQTEEKIKSPVLAGALNLLPGFGNFYLAVGTDQGEQWLVGFLNFLFWPLSVLWGIPEAVIDAGNINSLETYYYYYHDPRGIEELEALKARE